MANKTTITCFDLLNDSQNTTPGANTTLNKIRSRIRIKIGLINTFSPTGADIFCTFIVVAAEVKIQGIAKRNMITGEITWLHGNIRNGTINTLPARAAPTAINNINRVFSLGLLKFTDEGAKDSSGKQNHRLNSARPTMLRMASNTIMELLN